MAKFCENCGAELKENREICLECGKYVSNNTSHATNQNPNNSIAVV